MQKHTTVLMEEAITALQIRPADVIVDATLGSGGHALNILGNLGREGTLVAFDADQEAINACTHKDDPRAKLVVTNFRRIRDALHEVGISGADAILADLGWRIEQFSRNGKGFSFLVDEPLIMTYGEPDDYLFTARDVLNEWDESDIANVLKGYGEERYAKRIARALVATREAHPIERTVDLRSVIDSAVPKKYLHGRIHPATRTFQALRIAVNDELAALTEFIQQSIELLNPGGRLVIISFHSIEDRIVKHSFRDFAKEGTGEVITKKPITPTKEEQKSNPRSRGAKMRIFQKNENL